MKQRTLSVVASTSLVFFVLTVAVFALPRGQSDPADEAPAQQPSGTVFVEQFTSRYLLAVAQRREVQDYDLSDGRAWAKSILNGANEKTE